MCQVLPSCAQLFVAFYDILQRSDTGFLILLAQDFNMNFSFFNWAKLCQYVPTWANLCTAFWCILWHNTKIWYWYMIMISCDRKGSFRGNFSHINDTWRALKSVYSYAILHRYLKLLLQTSVPACQTYSYHLLCRFGLLPSVVWLGYYYFIIIQWGICCFQICTEYEYKYSRDNGWPRWPWPNDGK